LRILVDTHVFIWAVAAPERLSPRQRSELESRANIVYLSSVSVAEIMVKASLGKLRFDHDAIACAGRLGFELLDFFRGRCRSPEGPSLSPSRSVRPDARRAEHGAECQADERRQPLHRLRLPPALDAAAFA